MSDLAVDLDADYEALIQFMYLSPVGLAQIDRDGEVLMINPISAQLLMPLSRDASLSNLFTVLEPVLPDLRHTAASFTKPHGMVCDGIRVQVSAGIRGKSDPQVLSLSLLKLDATRLMAVLSDISEQVKREAMLRENEMWFDAIFTGVSDYALVCLDGAGCIVEWNASIGRVTGFDEAAVVGQPFSVFYPRDAITPDRIGDRLREADASGWSLDDGWRLRADGSRFWGSGMIAMLPDRSERFAALAGGFHSGKGAYCLIIRDITEKRDHSEQQRKLTSCDHLTEIANRRTFFEVAELEIERWRRSPRPLSMIVFDADLFKTINDRYGHPAGDAVLRDFARAMTEQFRPVDTVSRIGGEEFAVLLPSTSLEHAHLAAERVRAAVERRRVEVDGVAIAYTVSGGVASMDGGTGGLDEWMKRADRALYAAKAAGRNRIESRVPMPEAID